jgi:histidine ammonia-lyase
LITLGDGPLTLASLEQIARGQTSVDLSDEARARISASADALGVLASSGRPIYGVNTGFGIFADRRIQPDQSANLSRNLVLSHSVGVGPPLSPALVRAAMAIRANTLAQGHSGVRVALVERLLQMLNAGVTPIIPSQGSLGASGDLAPLSHLALVLTRGEHSGADYSGRAWFESESLSGAEAMRRAGLERIRLGPKEGLALNNGASFSTALLALSVLEIQRTLKTSELILALGATLADRLPTDASGQPSTRTVAEGDAPHQRLEALVSEIRSAPSSPPSDSLREAYTLGAVREVLIFTEGVLQREMNAATDNPLIFGEEALSGGNFHGQPIGLAADGCKRALVEAGHLMYTRLSMPPQLQAIADDHWPEYPAETARLFADRLMRELRRLAHPDSILSLPTSADQEDQNPNAWNATRRLADAAIAFRTLTALGFLAAMRSIRPKDLPSFPPTLRAMLEPVQRQLAKVVSVEMLNDYVDQISQSIREGGVMWEGEDVA